MKRLMVLGFALTAAMAQGGVRPEALQLKGYEFNGDGMRQSVYTVRCSNRTEPLINSKEGVKRWCAEGSKQCFRDKMDAAQAACDNSLRERLAKRR